MTPLKVLVRKVNRARVQKGTVTEERTCVCHCIISDPVGLEEERVQLKYFDLYGTKLPSSRVLKFELS